MFAELHCHLDGVLDTALAAELGLGVELPRVRTLADWELYSARVAQLPDRARWLPRVLERHVARLREQRVSYAELFVSGVLFVHPDEAALVDYFAELRAIATAAVELVICVGRGTPERLARQVPRIAALRRAGLICGVAFAGDEAHPIRPLARSIAELRELGLGIEIHAGELAGPESVRDAIEHGSPDRLGHALSAFGDRELEDLIASRGIHVELCPSSNLALSGRSGVERAQQLGISFSINTDDPGAFGCTLASELALAQVAPAAVFDHAMRAAFRGR
ncbi:MAG TPA: hypothetical protein VGG28_00360 [Kofleriaceae bacterium]|jgi:adenosine deaminase